METVSSVSSDFRATYKHDPLPAGPNIRILTLQPSKDFHSDIECVLTHDLLDATRGSYEALSYVWGSTVSDHRIICNGQPFYVTKNCSLALRYLRKRSKIRSMWIDAICIDQSSTKERGHQVELMGEIYQAAANVVIWLGEAIPGTKNAFRSLRCYGFLKSAFGMIFSFEDSKHERKVPPVIRQLMRHAWFYRSWTFQEFVLASSATIRCGRHSIPWDDFVHSLRGQDCSEINDLNRQWHCLGMEFAKIFYRDGFLVEGAAQLYNKDALQKPEARLREQVMYYFMRNLSQRTCSEPLDRVYSIYGLFRGLGFDLPSPDYNKTTQETFREFTLNLIKGMHSLWPLYVYVDQGFLADYATWVIDWMQPKIGFWWDRLWGKDETHLFHQKFQPRADDHYLFLRGSLHSFEQTFDTPVPDYSELEDANVGKIVASKWLQRTLHSTDHIGNCPNGQLAWEALITAFFRGYGPYLGARKWSPSLLFRLGFVPPSLPRNVHIRDIKTEKRQHKLLDTLEDDSISQELLWYVRDDDNGRRADLVLAIWYTALQCTGGQLFRTSDGWIGISMKPYQSTDVLALLHGSSVPAVLRPAGESFELVCFASVEGMPDDVWPINGDEPGVREIILI